MATNQQHDPWSSHEVPTHVQSSDSLILGLSFIQVIMLMVCLGGAYAIYVMPMLAWIPDRFRVGLAIGLALIAATMMIVKVGGRPIPILLLNLLKFRIAPQAYEGTPADLLAPRPEETADSDAEDAPSPIRRLFSRRAGSSAQPDTEDVP